MRPDSCFKKQKSRFNLYPGGRIHYRFQGANESGYRLKRLRYLPRQQLNCATVFPMCQVVGMLLAASWQAVSSYSLERLAGATNEPQHLLSHTNTVTDLICMRLDPRLSEASSLKLTGWCLVDRVLLPCNPLAKGSSTLP